MKNRYLLLVAFIFAALTGYAAKSMSINDSDVNHALQNLDKELNRRDVYKKEREARIQSIEQSLYENTENDSVEKRINLTMNLADAFAAYDNDSTLFYLKKGYTLSDEIKNDTMATHFLLKYITYLPLAGKAVESIELFEKIDTAGMSDNMYIEYLKAATQMSSYVVSSFADQPELAAFWKSKTKTFQKELCSKLSSDSPLKKYHEAEYYFSLKDYDKATVMLKDLMDNEPESSNIRARAGHGLALIAQAFSDEKAYTYYLALSAISDVKSATLEITSLQLLGMHLFEKGDLDRAYMYLSAALENAVECNASMRVLETSATLPIIEKAHTAQARESMQILTVAFIIAALLLIVVVSLLINLRIQVNRKTVLQGHLEGANRVKEIYLSQFINLCTVYMSKLTSFNKMVERKITSGKTEDLAKITKSGKFIEEQSKEFYEIFDEAFLHIYPSFVESVNALLLPDKQIQLLEGEKLNTDLRILAFIRLGLEDSSRVAQMLNYSVNTIYAYRNRLRNRAINRDTFEDDLMKISSI